MSLDPKSVTLTQFVAAAAFVWAWHHQRRAHQILARIRLVIQTVKHVKMFKKYLFANIRLPENLFKYVHVSEQ